MTGSLKKVGFQLGVSLWLNANTGVPFVGTAAGRREAGSTIADRVAFESNRISTAITDILLSSEWVMAFGIQEKKPVLESNVLHVRESSCLAMGSLAFGNVDAVFGHEFSINVFWILCAGDAASCVPPISVSQVGNRNLLNKSFRGTGYTSILHRERVNHSNTVAGKGKIIGDSELLMGDNGRRTTATECWGTLVASNETPTSVWG